MYFIEKTFDEFIKENEMVDYGELKGSFLKVINEINNEHLMTIIREFPKHKPIIQFKTLYFILEEFKPYGELDHEFEVMRRYLDKNIDIFMLVNYLRQEDL